MRTNIVLDDVLIKEAGRYVNVSSKRELINLALREFIANHQRRDIRELLGKVKIASDYEHKKMR